LRLASSAEARREARQERFLEAARRHGVRAIGTTDGRGHRYYFDPRDRVVGRALFMDGGYEVRPIDEAARVLARRGFAPELVIDIGANIGTSTVEWLSRFPAAVGAAFEPDATNVELLWDNFSANRLLDRTVIFPVALSDRDGTVQLERSEDNFGDHRVRVGDVAGCLGEDRREVSRVPARRFDTVVRSGELTVADRVLTHMDAQGHEGHILAAAQLLLVHPMLVEYWPYGLQRSGGLELFLDALEAYADITVLDGDRRSIGVTALRDLARQLGVRHVDLLLVP
jgi:FkbM family methyltransferase